MNIIALILARGGSKRFPGKNLYPLLGKPLIAHSIIAAKATTKIDRVIVSTDSEEIAAVAREYTAEVPFMRPSELASDSAKAIDVVRHIIGMLEQDGYKAGYVVTLQPTTPVIEPAQIDAAIELAIEKNAESVVNVSEIDTINHPYNIREIREDGTAHFWQEKLHYEALGKDRPKFYHAANLWLSSYDTVMKEGKFEGEKNYPIIVPPIYSSDIDFKEDLERLEAILSSWKKNG
ncbi:acylneuraminate cytidylyltransferase family protein [Candidatus Parcubacteria bacterium]|nr:MAG: acylneuraminate cytidylyltransferase family protein [Candidatus Parcubacteria bacterium]